MSRTQTLCGRTGSFSWWRSWSVWFARRFLGPSFGCSISRVSRFIRKACAWTAAYRAASSLKSRVRGSRREGIYGKMRFHLNNCRTNAVKTKDRVGGANVAPPKSLRVCMGSTREVLRNSFGAHTKAIPKASESAVNWWHRTCKIVSKRHYWGCVRALHSRRVHSLTALRGSPGVHPSRYRLPARPRPLSGPASSATSGKAEGLERGMARSHTALRTLAGP